MELAINKETHVKRKLLILLIVQLLFCASVFAQTTTVILVRHSEKSTAPTDDPVLSDQGKARAEMLSRMLENSGLTAVYTSQYARTKLTAEPIARKLNVPVQNVDAASSKKLVDTILAKNKGGTILIVGHSNTLHEIVTALGAGPLQEMDDTDYDNLYVVTVFKKGTAKLLRLKFFNPNTEQVCQ
jgi:broad specificity phosphatase PhoE